MGIFKDIITNILITKQFSDFPLILYISILISGNNFVSLVVGYMIIRKRRIMNLKSNLGFIASGTKIIVGLDNIDRFKPKLENMGFTETMEVGDSVLPISKGPVSRFNANGKNIIHKNKPKETVTYQREHEWTEWHGRQRVRKTGYVDFSVERYPRTFIEPPSIELTISALVSGSKLIISPTIELNESNETIIKHTINLFLENFNECTIYTEDLDNIIQEPIKRLNWEVLPTGPMPWQVLHSAIHPMLRNIKKLIKPVIEWRISTLHSYNPDFVAIGQAGFRGYIGFVFESKDICIFESIYHGNATYVFDKEWEELSKKTKAEILSHNLQKNRIIHNKGWRRKIRYLMTS